MSKAALFHRLNAALQLNAEDVFLLGVAPDGVSAERLVQQLQESLTRPCHAFSLAGQTDLLQALLTARRDTSHGAVVVLYGLDGVSPQDRERFLRRSNITRDALGNSNGPTLWIVRQHVLQWMGQHTPDLVRWAGLPFDLRALAPRSSALISTLAQQLREQDARSFFAFISAGSPSALYSMHVEVRLSRRTRSGSPDDLDAPPWPRAWGSEDSSFPIRRVLSFPQTQWMLLGHPGSGKSTLLRRLALELLQTGERIPMLLKVADVISHGGDLLDAMAAEWPGTSRAALREAIDDRSAVVLLDGLDEASDAELAHQAVRETAQAAGGCPIIVASRLTGYSPLDGWGELYLCHLGDVERQALLSAWLEDSERATRVLQQMGRNPRLRRLAENPLLLTLVGVLLRQDPDAKIPSQRSTLYARIIAWLLTRRHEQTVRKLPDPQSAQDALGHIALKLHSQEGQVYSTQHMVQALETDTHLRDRILRHYTDAASFFRDVAAISGLLVPSDARCTGYHFPHRTFREFLAAQALERDIARNGLGAIPPDALDGAGKTDQPRTCAPAPGLLGGILDDARRHPERWSEVLALCCGLLGPGAAELLVRRLAAEGAAKLLQRVVAEAENIGEDTAWVVLGLERGGENWEDRRDLIAQLPALTGDVQVAARLAWKLATTTTNGNDLWFTRQLLLDIYRGRVTGSAGEWQEDDLKGDALEQASRVVAQLRERYPARHQEAVAWARAHAVWVAPGAFVMGTPEDEEGRYGNEGPQHDVTLTEGHWLLSVPVTSEVYELFDPDHHSDRAFADAGDVSAHPVVNVTWFEAAMFAEWLGGVLPTEAQWEHAARAGTTTRYWWGDDEDGLSRHAWWDGNADVGRPRGTHRGTRPVGAAGHANPWGLSDMLGNVWEWCRDGLRDYSDAAMTDPCHLSQEGSDTVPTLVDTAPHCVDKTGYFVDTLSSFALRGGSWISRAWLLRCGERISYRSGGRDRGVGFRVVLRRQSEYVDG